MLFPLYAIFRIQPRLQKTTNICCILWPSSFLFSDFDILFFTISPQMWVTFVLINSIRKVGNSFKISRALLVQASFRCTGAWRQVVFTEDFSSTLVIVWSSFLTRRTNCASKDISNSLNSVKKWPKIPSSWIVENCSPPVQTSLIEIGKRVVIVCEVCWDTNIVLC